MVVDRNNTLTVNEIFYSIQGESSQMGRPCVFVRLTYCNLRCTYCDTTYSFFEGKEFSIDDIIAKVAGYGCNLVEITGGEPLIQKNVHRLMYELCDQGYEVMIETAGHMDIDQIDKRVKRIMDIKCPSSGESEKINWANFASLKETDEVKFVVGDRKDFEWALNVVEKHHLIKKCPVLFSPVFNTISNQDLANWILETELPLRLQLQLHKYIWEPKKRGV